MMISKNTIVFLILFVLLYPTIINAVGVFQCYELCPNSRFKDLFPKGTYVLKPFCVNELKRMFTKLVPLLNDANVVHFVIGGSLLGHQRHKGGIIPFDDDIDILSSPLSPSQIKTIQNGLPKDLSFIYFGGWYKIISKKIPFCDRLSIAIDLFEYTTLSGTTLTLRDECSRKKWPKETWPEEHIFPLKPTVFCDVPCYVPNQPLKVLFQSYGNDCLEIAYINNVHGAFAYLANSKLNLKRIPKKIKVTPEQRSIHA